jgi:hypothetical protein
MPHKANGGAKSFLNLSKSPNLKAAASLNFCANGAPITKAWDNASG